MLATAASLMVEKEAQERHATSVWLQVASHLDPKFGGLSSAVPALAAAAESAGPHIAPFAVFCGADEDISHIGARQLHAFRFPHGRSRWMREKSLQAQLRDLIESADGVHIHGVWAEYCSIAGNIARESGKPYLVAAHGMLEGWAMQQKRLRKMLYSRLVERPNLREATCLQALTSVEVEDYRRFGLTNPIAVIPNGVEVPLGATADDFLEAYPALRGKRLALFLGRLSKKKGLDLLCRAWSNLRRQFPDAHLVIAGPDYDGTRPATENLVERFGMGDSVTFTGMLEKGMKWSALAAAHVFVLPSFSEGFSAATLEALGMGVPAIVTRRCNFPEVAEQRCGMVIEADARQVEEALGGMLAADDREMSVMRENARRLIAGRYTWSAIGKQISAVYEWILGGHLPSNVEISRCPGGIR